MRSIVILLLLLGVIMIAVGYVKTNQECPPPVVEFRYVPKTFEQEQDLPVPLLSIYGKMFNNASPWQVTQGYADQVNTRKLSDTNNM